MKLGVLVYDHNPMGHCPGWMYLVASGFRANGAAVFVLCHYGDSRVASWAKKLAAEGCVVSDIPDSIRDHSAHAEATARQKGVTRIFFPNFDSIIYEMGKYRLSGAFAGMDIGGIWLRPDLCDSSIGWMEKCKMKVIRSRANKLARRYARTVANNRRGLAGFLKPKAKTRRMRLFFTNSAALANVAGLLGDDSVAMICDPWLEKASVAKRSARAALGINPGRIVLLHAGTPRPEKGLKDACSAILDMGDKHINQLCLLRAGNVDSLDLPCLKSLQQLGAAKILDYYVSEDELQLCYAAADWVLLPYRFQKESSGLLIHAAANVRPVIASDYGIIGNCVKAYQLGRLFTHCDIEALRQQIMAVIESNEHDGWDTSGMERFADSNSPAAFQQTLVEAWLTDTGYPESS